MHGSKVRRAKRASGTRQSKYRRRSDRCRGSFSGSAENSSSPLVFFLGGACHLLFSDGTSTPNLSAIVLRSSLTEEVCDDFCGRQEKSAIAASTEYVGKQLTVGLLIKSRTPCHDGRRDTKACALANPVIDGGEQSRALNCPRGLRCLMSRDWTGTRWTLVTSWTLLPCSSCG